MQLTSISLKNYNFFFFQTDNASVTNDVTDYSGYAKQTVESYKRKYPYEEDDPDLNFLKSLLPDMKSMTDNQKRKFKINVLKLSDDILNAV